MNPSNVTFFGSKADIQSLKESLSKLGFKEVPDPNVRANVPAGEVGLLALIVSYNAPQIVDCLKAWMATRSKRMIQTITPDGTKKTLKGNFTYKQFKDFADETNAITIEDDKAIDNA